MMKMLGNFGALVVLGLVLPACTRAQAAAGALPAPVPQRLTLHEAVQTALEKHPALRQAEAAVAKAEAQVAEVRANYYPQLSLSGIAKTGLSGATGVLGLPGFPGSPFYRNLAYSANWYQNIFDFGRTKHRVASQEALAESTRLKKKAEADRIVLGVRRAYFTVLEAQKLQSLAEKTVQERQLTLKRVQAFSQAGMQSKLEVSLAEANRAEAEGNLIQARNALHTALAALRAAMGVESGTEYQLEELSLEYRTLPPGDEMLRTALSKRPDYLAVEAKVNAFTEELGKARSERLPEIRGLGATGQGRFKGTPVKPNQRHGVGALGIFFPFFTGGRLEAEQQEARAELSGALASRDLLRQQIQFDVTEARDRLSSLAGHIQEAAQQERAAQEALRLGQARYRAQLASFLDLTTAEVALARAETNHARLVFDYERAVADLDFSIGQAFQP